VGSSSSHNLTDLQGLLWDSFIFTLLSILKISGGAIKFAIPSLKPVMAMCFLMLKHGKHNYSLLGYDMVV
jgi:hypothetical protein